jgi:hypothetical protein
LLKVKVEDPNALRFILQDDVYLLEEDRPQYNTAPKPLPVVETPPVNFNYLGSNKKNFLILVYYPGHEHIADDHLAALESVLGRKSHNRDDVAIVNIAKNDGRFELLKTYFEPKTLLILGQEAMPVDMKKAGLNTVEKHDDITALFTFSFDEMMNSTENKKAFWDQVKTL